MVCFLGDFSWYSMNLKVVEFKTITIMKINYSLFMRYQFFINTIFCPKKILEIVLLNTTCCKIKKDSKNFSNFFVLINTLLPLLLKNW